MAVILALIPYFSKLLPFQYIFPPLRRLFPPLRSPFPPPEIPFEMAETAFEVAEARSDPAEPNCEAAPAPLEAAGAAAETKPARRVGRAGGLTGGRVGFGYLGGDEVVDFGGEMVVEGVDLGEVVRGRVIRLEHCCWRVAVTIALTLVGGEFY